MKIFMWIMTIAVLVDADHWSDQTNPHFWSKSPDEVIVALVSVILLWVAYAITKYAK